jgi:hypothetical protein
MTRPCERERVPAPAADEIDVMLDHDQSERVFGVVGLERLSDTPPLGRVEPRGGLVDQHHFGRDRSIHAISVTCVWRTAGRDRATGVGEQTKRAQRNRTTSRSRRRQSLCARRLSI